MSGEDNQDISKNLPAISELSSGQNLDNKPSKVVDDVDINTSIKKTGSKKKSEKSVSYKEIDLIKTTHTDSYKKEDPPLIDLKVTNPITYFKKWWKRVMANEGMVFSFRIRPLTAVAIGASFAIFFGGTGFGIAKTFFPNSSPILRREILYQGMIKKTNENYYLMVGGSTAYLLKSDNFDLKEYIDKQVLLRGNLNREPNVIMVSEVTVF